MKLLNHNFVINLIAQSKIFAYIQKKHGQKKLQQVRELQSLMLRYVRRINDIKYIKNYKGGNIVSFIVFTTWDSRC